MQPKWLRILLLLLSVMGFLAVRALEQDLFYDPFITFFKGDHQHAAIPQLQWGKYLLHVVLRYASNALLSLLTLWALFQNKEYLRFALLLMLGLLVLFLPLMVILIHTSQPGSYMALFYVRRFLMHPLLVLLLIPAFYFYKKA